MAAKKAAADSGKKNGKAPATPVEELPRENFIPIARFALIDRLTRDGAWPGGEAKAARRFFRYLDYWRQQQYNAKLIELQQDYEPFSPDSDLLVTRSFTRDEKKAVQGRFAAGMSDLLVHANYTEIDPSRIEMILTKGTHYGLDLHVDLKAFEMLRIFYRGRTSITAERRALRKFFRKEEFDVPIFRRFFVLFKLKSEADRVQDFIRDQRMTREEAEKAVRKLRGHVPENVSDDNIYMKLFKNMPVADLEMAFPNARVQFRTFDKIKLGVTGGGAFGMGAFGAAGKLALLISNPIGAAGAVAGLGGLAFRQVMNFANQRQKYMVVMARNLYFHSMADNRGVMIKLAERAAEEDIKEEVLLYSVLAKSPAKRSDLPTIDAAIESYLKRTFDIDVDFDVAEALGRLKDDGIVTEDAEGNLIALAPHGAALHIDAMWDMFLDNLPDPSEHEGIEMQDDPSKAPHI